MSSKTELNFELDSSENVIKSENEENSELPEEEDLLSNHVEK